MTQKRKKDKLCVDYRICLTNELDEVIERLQLEKKHKTGLRLRKSEVAEQLFHKLAQDASLI